MDLKDWIREVPDFPSPGIGFKDITPMLQHPEAFAYATDQLAELIASAEADAILAVEARGFLFGAALAYKLNLPLVPARKPGKLPYESISVRYTLEYAEDVMEMHVDGLAKGQSVAVIDDVIATGGSLEAACKLVEKTGASVGILATVVELTFLGGRERLAGYNVASVISY